MKKYWLKVKTKRYIAGYGHETSTNMPGEMNIEMGNLIEEYNKKRLDEHPGKNNLVTKVIMESEFTRF